MIRLLIADDEKLEREALADHGGQAGAQRPPASSTMATSAVTLSMPPPASASAISLSTASEALRAAEPSLTPTARRLVVAPYGPQDPLT